MTRRFRGESIHKVDQKGRVSVPASFRRVIEEGDPDWNAGNQPGFVLIHGFPGRNCLEGYTSNGIEELDAMVELLPRFSRQRQALERLLNTKSTPMQIDDNGRINLNAAQRAAANLDGEAVFAGMGQHFQIWSPEAFETDDAELLETIEDAGGADALENLFAAMPGSGATA